MDNNLVELLKTYYKTVRDQFINEMADFMDHSLNRKLENEIKELEKQIIEYAGRPDAFKLFTESIETIDPDVFSKLIADLDSDSESYDTLYDLFTKYNNIHLSNVVFPDDAIKKIKIIK